MTEKNRIFLDESGVEQNLFTRFARSKRGIRAIGEILSKRKERISVIAGYSGKQLLSPFYFKGHTNSKIFNVWLENEPLPEIGTGKVLILDNAAFHKTSKTKELVEKSGCQLLYLPPYSPDFNPIEQQWAILKHRIRTIQPDPGLDFILTLENQLARMSNCKLE